MKVTMTEAICKEGMALLEDKARIFVAHDAHPHNYLDQLKDTDMFIAVSYTHLTLPTTERV